MVDEFKQQNEQAQRDKSRAEAHASYQRNHETTLENLRKLGEQKVGLDPIPHQKPTTGGAGCMVVIAAVALPFLSFMFLR